MMEVTIRRARREDAEALRGMQALSLCSLGADRYSAEQVAAFLAHVGTMDEELLDEGTYFVAERDGELVGSGGWSLRTPGYAATAAEPEPHRGGAPTVRSVFVHPTAARRGVGTLLVDTVEADVIGHGHHSVRLTATRSGEAFYAALGYRRVAPAALALPDGTTFPCTRMAKELTLADAMRAVSARAGARVRRSRGAA
jgi:GNAT superfamily N-acetyltransferase